MFTIKNKILVLCLVAVSASACTTSIERKKALESKTSDEFEFQKMRSDSYVRELTRKKRKTDFSLESKLPYVNTRMIKAKPRLPQVFSEEVFWYFPVETELELRTFKRMILDKTGFKLIVDGKLKGSETDFSEGNASLDSSNTLQILTPPQEEGAVEEKEVFLVFDKKEFIPIEKILTIASSQLGYEWELNLDERAIEFKSLFTESFLIETPIGSDTLLPETIFVGGDKVNIPKVNESSKLWESIENSIASFLTVDGKVTINEKARLVTVTDTKQALRKAKEYMRELNAILSASVLVNIEIIEYQFEDSGELGLNLTMNLLDGSDGLVFSSVNGVLNQSIIAPIAGVKKGSWQGSQSVINALNKTGKVTKSSRHPVRARNNTIGSLSSSRVKGFLESVSQPVTNATGGSSGGSLKQGYIRSGKTINILPHILKDRDTLLLDIGINMSQLNKFDDITDGHQSIQSPDVNVVQINESVRIRSGETMILTSIDENETRNEESGWLDSAFWWLGGNHSKSVAKKVTVITITPYIF